MSTTKTEAVIQINGDPNGLPITAQQIISISVSNEVNKIPSALIIIKDGQVNEQTFSISNQNYFKPGVPIEIFIGDPQLKNSVFKGIVTSHQLKIKKNRPSLLLVECRDEAIRLTIGRKSRFWIDTSDSDIFASIADDYAQVDINAEDSRSIVVHQQISQYYSSDWDFIAMRSEALGHYIFTEGGRLTIQEPKLEETAKITLEYGAAADTKEKSRIWEFESDLDALHQFDSINTLGWDYSKQGITEGTNSFQLASESGNITGSELSEVIELKTFNLYHQAKMNENELNALANAVKQKSLLNKNRGRVKIDGRSDIKPGQMATLNGVGDRFNGNVFVSRIQHTFEPGRWFTQIQFGLPYSWFHENENIPNPAAQGLLPPIKGLQIGKVIKIRNESKPDKNFRLKVFIPGMHENNEGVWARLATFNAGNNRGALFLPELDDEVVLGYIGQDSREPIILGSMYSEKNAPTFTNTDDNFIKGFYTRNKHKIEFDDEKNTITIVTDGKQKIILDDSDGKIELSDKNNNKVTMDASGITLKSAKDISLEAPTGNVNVKALKVEVVGNSGVDINYVQGGMVKMGNGVLPAAATSDLVTPAFLIGPAKNVKVLI